MQRKEPLIKNRSLANPQNQPLTTLEEQQLLQRLAEGEINVFWQLWQHHHKYLYSRCLGWMGGNPVEAEEALSLAMLKAREKLPKYAVKITNLRAWLTRFTHNLCVDIHRNFRKKAIGTESIEDIDIREQEEVISSFDSPESAILRDELGQFIRTAVNALPERLRTPFILRYYQEVSYPDIARQLAISQDNTYKRIQQARDLLEKNLRIYFAGVDNSVLYFSATSFNKSNSVVNSCQLESLLELNLGCMFAGINYQVTATCLEKISHSWYQSSSLQGWR